MLGGQRVNKFNSQSRQKVENCIKFFGLTWMSLLFDRTLKNTIQKLFERNESCHISVKQPYLLLPLKSSSHAWKFKELCISAHERPTSTVCLKNELKESNSRFELTRIRTQYFTPKNKHEQLNNSRIKWVAIKSKLCLLISCIPGTSFKQILAKIRCVCTNIFRFSCWLALKLARLCAITFHMIQQ